MWKKLHHIFFFIAQDPCLQLLKEIQDLNPIFTDTFLQSLFNLYKNDNIKLKALEKFYLCGNRFKFVIST